ncbi:hypothetical protein FRC03_001112 [Tulasnella sp. 419]|nr:hypothetical protein FRC03_001112 [Tulasnella sp. 419]
MADAWNNPDDNMNGGGGGNDNGWSANGPTGDHGRTPPPPPNGMDGSRSRNSRSRSPGPRRDDDRGRNADGSTNPGNNLHVSGLSSRVDNRDLEALFAKHGKVAKASVMYDPHTRESRGFGFVTMETATEADACIAALNGTDVHGKPISIERARRGRARTPTPGRYFGPPKRIDDRERPYDPRPYDSRYAPSRYDDRRYDDRRYEDRYGPPPRPYYEDRRRYDDRRDYERRDYDRRDYDRRDYDRREYDRREAYDRRY